MLYLFLLSMMDSGQVIIILYWIGQTLESKEVDKLMIIKNREIGKAISTIYFIKTLKIARN